MDLTGHAQQLGVEVRYVEHLDRWGRYSDSSRTIFLLSGLGVTQWRTTLAHECGHAYWRHSSDGPREERQADAYAVGLLIPPPAWARATAYAETLGEVAQELNVLPRLVEAAQRIYADCTFCNN